MNPYDQATPGNDYIDLRDVCDERDAIWTALKDASYVRDADEIAENQNDPRGDDRCSNECVCTVAEKIEAGELDGAWQMVAEDDSLWDAAGLDEDDYNFMVAVQEIDLWCSLDDAARNEPTMILVTAFVDYAQELAEAIGAIDRNAGWPASHIDWEAAADSLKTDYSEVIFGGYMYFWRNY